MPMLSMKRWLLSILTEFFADVKAAIIDTVRDEVRDGVKQITAAVVLGFAESTSKIATEGLDKLTEAIPGDLDDRIVDEWAKPIVDSVLERLGISLR